MFGQALRFFVLLLYLLQLFLLGFRPWIPPLYRALHGSDIGAWNMYKYRTQRQVTAQLRGAEATVVPLTWRQYIWHNRHLVGTPINQLTPSTLDAFSKFLARQPAVHALAGDVGRPWRVSLEVQIQRNAEAPVVVRSEYPLFTLTREP
jgi:hypothetical protein